MNKAAGLAIAAAVGLLAGCGSEPEAPGKTTQQLMAEDVQPTAEIYWNTVRYESVLENDKPVDRDILPSTDEDWKRAGDAADRLVELANLLQTPAYATGRRSDWAQFAGALAEASQRAQQAVAERSVDKVFETGGLIYSVCSACHLAYPPASGIPPSVAPSGENPA